MKKWLLGLADADTRYKIKTLGTEASDREQAIENFAHIIDNEMPGLLEEYIPINIISVSDEFYKHIMEEKENEKCLWKV